MFAGHARLSRTKTKVPQLSRWDTGSSSISGKGRTQRETPAVQSSAWRGTDSRKRDRADQLSVALAPARASGARTAVVAIGVEEKDGVKRCLEDRINSMRSWRKSKSSFQVQRKGLWGEGNLKQQLPTRERSIFGSESRCVEWQVISRNDKPPGSPSFLYTLNRQCLDLRALPFYKYCADTSCRDE